MNSIYDPGYRRVMERLRKARREHGLTQDQAARALGWRRTMLSNLERFERRADLCEVNQLARLYGMRLSDLEPLLDGKGEAHAAQGK